MQLKDSSIPCAIFRFTATNNSDKKAEVGFLYSQQNAVDYSPVNNHGPKNSSVEFFENDVNFINLNRIKGKKFETYGQNVNRVLRHNNQTFIHMTRHSTADSQEYGDMTIGLLNEEGEARAGWETLQGLYDRFYKNSLAGKIEKSDPSRRGETVDAALSKTFFLEPGAKRTVTFFLTWYFPAGERGSLTTNSWGRGKWGGSGNMYCNWWENSLDVADYLSTNFKKLFSLTHLYHDTFYKSNFPHWLKDRITAQTAIMKTNTMFWDSDGYIGGWEGISPVDGACSGNCTHVWHYAQAHARLFPEIGRKMREQSFGFIKENGMIPYRHPDGHEAFDGQCGEVLQAYREHLLGTDDQWLTSNFPRIKMAMDFVIKTWDTNKDGILEGAKHNTLDSRLGGNSAWHGSLYAAALRAMSEMAVLQSQPDLAKQYTILSEQAIRSHLETLWNGEYFIQIPDSVPYADFLSGCATDQMLGQWWANQLNLGWLYPQEIVETTMNSVFNYNWKASFKGIKQIPREFVKSDEAGMQMITWPKGGRPNPHTSYADEVMSGFEYAAAATMIKAGKLKQGLVVLKSISDRYNGKLKVGYKGDWGNWGYSGNPFGDDECGKFYSRAMSSWSVLLAMQGFIYDGPGKIIGFIPVWQPENHVSFFSAAEAWGLYSQKRSGKEQVSSLDVEFGTLKLKEFQTGIENSNLRSVIVKMNNLVLPAEWELNRGVIRIIFKEISMQNGDRLVIKMQ